MLRSGLRSHAFASGFLSDDVSGEEMPTLQPKKVRRKKSARKTGSETHSVDEQPKDDKSSKKKKSKKSKKNSVAGDADPSEGRKIVQGKRRIQRQDNIDAQSPPKFKTISPFKTRQSSRHSPLKPLQGNESAIEVNQKFVSPKKTAKRRSKRNKENLANQKDDDDYHTADETASSSLNKGRSTIEVREDESKIVTSVQKYNEKMKLLNESFNISFEGECINLQPNARRGTFEISGVEINSRMLDKSTRRESKRNTSEVEIKESPQRALRSMKKGTLEVEKEESPLKTVIQTTKKRSTFEVTDVLEPRVTRRVAEHKESPYMKLPVKKGKRSYDIKEQPDEKIERRRTFDINANGLPVKLPDKNRKADVIDESIVILDESATSGKTRSSRRSSLKQEVKKPTTVATRKSLSSMHKKKLEKIRISDSKSSLSESGMSSPSIIFRRALRINPQTRTSTPNTANLKAVSSTKNKKSPLRSVSKVRKVPNYAVIHQNAYNKMESVDDHLERKALRAKALLSGQKVPIYAKITPADPKSKKQLSFLPGPVDNKANFKFTNKTTNSPLVFNSRRQLCAGDATVVLESQQPPKKTRNGIKVGFNVSTPIKGKNETPEKFAKTPRPTKAEIWNAYGTKIPRPAAPLFTTGAAPAGDAPMKEVQQLPLRVTTRNANRRKDAASVSSRSKASSSTVDSRRDHIKGVRSNRRFDLLMSMRK